jgi:hypothetical protein
MTEGQPLPAPPHVWEHRDESGNWVPKTYIPTEEDTQRDGYETYVRGPEVDC